MDKYRKEIQDQEKELYKQTDGIFFDGKKDATLVMTEIENKHYRSTVLEEHYVVVGEPGN